MAQLRVVLDQTGSPTEGEHAWVGRSLVQGLIETAPTGCDVAVIAPHGVEASAFMGLSDVRQLRLPHRELSAAWQLGLPTGVGAGMIHASSLLAPLVRHDRVHDNNQTVVTVWDLTAWESPESLPRTAVAWQRAMLRRAVKHADAVVVPSHAMAARLAEHAPLGDRIRVIAGAAPIGFAVPADAMQRRGDALIPERYVVMVGRAGGLRSALASAVAAKIEVVVLDVPQNEQAMVVDLAASVNLPTRHLHMPDPVGEGDRAAIIGGAEVVIVTERLSTWPWRAVEAMRLGVPLIAVSSDVHRDVFADGASIVDDADLTDALLEALGDGAARRRVLAADRGRAFTWQSAAERVWALHAEL